MKMRKEIYFEAALLRHELDNFAEEGWMLVRHTFIPAIGTGKLTRDSAKKKHVYTFEKNN